MSYLSYGKNSLVYIDYDRSRHALLNAVKIKTDAVRTKEERRALSLYAVSVEAFLRLSKKKDY